MFDSAGRPYVAAFSAYAHHAGGQQLSGNAGGVSPGRSTAAPIVLALLYCAQASFSPPKCVY